MFAVTEIRQNRCVCFMPLEITLQLQWRNFQRLLRNRWRGRDSSSTQPALQRPLPSHVLRRSYTEMPSFESAVSHRPNRLPVTSCKHCRNSSVNKLGLKKIVLHYVKKEEKEKSPPTSKCGGRSALDSPVKGDRSLTLSNTSKVKAGHVQV